MINNSSGKFATFKLSKVLRVSQELLQQTITSLFLTSRYFGNYNRKTKQPANQQMDMTVHREVTLSKIICNYIHISFVEERAHNIHESAMHILCQMSNFGSRKFLDKTCFKKKNIQHSLITI